jgi:hypothetical protein
MCQAGQPIIGSIVDKFALPVAVAVITYWLFKKNDEYIKRRQYSTLGVAIIEGLLEEINIGIEIMKNQFANLIPVKSWVGLSSIPDDVLLRIIAVTRNVNLVRFKPKDIRIHCKNYFDHMATSWNSAIQSNNQVAIQQLLNQGKYIEAAEGVKAMLLQCKELLENNEKRWFPK